MSIIKKFISHINKLPINSTLTAKDISKDIIKHTLSYDAVERYLDYLYDAKIIELYYTDVDEVAYNYGVIVYEHYYIKKMDIPTDLTIQKLKKLAKDETFRINYMRKYKIKQLKINNLENNQK